MADTDEDYAIIIGIDQYEAFKPLHGASADARAFESWARNHAKVPDCHIQVLADPDEPLPMSAIKEAFVRLALASDDGSKRVGRRLYIFLAGHGAGTDIDRSGLFASDHRKITPNLLSATDVANLFVRAALFDEVLLFMDCCRSFNGNLDGYNPFDRNAFDPGSREVRRCYAYAAKLDQKAREREFDGEEGYRGLFTKALVMGLEGHAAERTSNRVTVESLEKYVKIKMEEFGAKRQNAEFEPDDDILLVDVDDVPGTSVTVKLSEPERGFVVYHGGDIETPIDVERERIDDATWRVSLRANAQYLFVVLDEAGGWKMARPKTVHDDPEEISL